MSKTDTWMPLYIGDYLADTMHLDAREHGAYLLLIMHYWRTGPLPDDDRMLAGIARVERKVWVQDVAPVVRPFFNPADGKLRHKRIDEELEHVAEVSEKRRSAANRRYAKTRGGDIKKGGGDPSGGQQDASNQPAKVVQLQSKSTPLAEQMEVHARTCASASQSQSQDSEADASDAASASDAPSDKDLLWSGGLPAVCRVTRLGTSQARALIGRLVRDSGNDHAAVLALVRRCEEVAPFDAQAWLVRAVTPQPRATSRRWCRPDPNADLYAKYGLMDVDPRTIDGSKP